MYFQLKTRVVNRHSRSEYGTTDHLFSVKIKLRYRSKKMNVIGPKVKKFREAQGITQEELAARCNVLEWDLSRGTLAKIEAKVRRVTDGEVALLAKALQVNIGELFL